MASNDTLSFAELDRRLRAVPQGPSGILDTPPLYRIANLVGSAGFLLALVPQVLVRMLTAAPWMLTMVQIGFAIMVMGWLPIFVRQVCVMGLTMWRWRQEQVEQLDHDRPQFEALLAWLCRQPADALHECRRMVGVTHRQLTAKIGLLAGGLDRLGILPAIAATYLFVRNAGDILDMPTWELLAAAFLILLWLIVTLATLMRIRLQLYEALLTEALAMKSPEARPS